MEPGVACRSLLACPKCLGHLAEWACVRCGATYETPGGIPRLLLPLDPRTERVRRFYEVSPFPGYPPHEDLAALRARSRRSEFARRLDAAIPTGAIVLELGCGTGQMSLFLASGGRRVVATDVARAPLELAAQAARQMGVESVLFVETDLRQPGLRPDSFDVVCALGVLHHTPNPRASFASVSRLVRPGGAVVVGLYNAFARFPHRLRRAVAHASGFRWFPWDPILRARADQPSRKEAWIRDQYLHPEEHHHTLREVKGWFAENGISYLRSVPDALLDAPENQDLFSPAKDSWGLEELLAQIGWMATLSHEGGLFIAVGRRAPLAGSLPARMSNGT
jgi:2-polyprenyl-3-methyl-5-hydroxy-6-metoxy-1,4-benzoquinol methylase